MRKVLLLTILCMMCAGTALAQEEAGEVARAAFSTGIENREPVEIITEYFPAEDGVVFFFTDLKNMQDTKVFHVWHKNGEEIYRFTSNVASARWRTSSSMKAMHFKPGDEIIVEIVGPDDAVFESKTLSIR